MAVPINLTASPNFDHSEWFWMTTNDFKWFQRSRDKSNSDSFWFQTHLEVWNFNTSPKKITRLLVKVDGQNLGGPTEWKWTAQLALYIWVSNISNSPVMTLYEKLPVWEHSKNGRSTSWSYVPEIQKFLKCVRVIVHPAACKNVQKWRKTSNLKYFVTISGTFQLN